MNYGEKQNRKCWAELRFYVGKLVRGGSLVTFEQKCSCLENDKSLAKFFLSMVSLNSYHCSRR